MNTGDKTTEIVMRQAIGLRNSGKLREALSTLLPCVAPLKKSGAGCGLMATVYFELGDSGEAAKWFSYAVRLAPQSEKASLGLFHSLWALGKTDGAFDEMRRFMIVGESAEYPRLLKALGKELDVGAIAPSTLPLDTRATINAAEGAGIRWRKSRKKLKLLRELQDA